MFLFTTIGGAIVFPQFLHSVYLYYIFWTFIERPLRQAKEHLNMNFCLCLIISLSVFGEFLPCVRGYFRMFSAKRPHETIRRFRQHRKVR